MTYDSLFTALADPRRRQLLEALRASPQAVGQLALSQPVSRPAISQHLKVLEDAGLVCAQAQGTRRIYRVAPEGVEKLRRYVDSFWGDALDDFANYINEKKE